MAVSEDSVEVQLRVGMLDLALAKLMTEDHHTIEFPTILLPENVEAGSIVRLQCSRALQAENEDKTTFDKVQQEILTTFATNLPDAPVLRAKNVTQTSVVLEWDPIQVASSDLHFVALYKGAQRLGLIPQPLKRTLTKVSNLEIDAPYDFRIVLSTSAGQFESNKLEIKTHKMTDLTGVVVCVGSLAHSDVTTEKIEESLKRLGCVPPQDNVKLDTTHFVCTTGGGAAFERAMDLNIPIVRPDWLQACEYERRLVSVRGYYLSTDPAMYVNAKSAQEAQTPPKDDPSQPVQEQHNQPQGDPTEEVVSQDQNSGEQHSGEQKSGELNEAGETQENGQKQESSEALNIAEHIPSKEDHSIPATEPSAQNDSAQNDETAQFVEEIPESNISEVHSEETHSEGNTVGEKDEITDEKTHDEEPSSDANENQLGEGDEEPKTIGNPDALSSHDELSEAVNNIGDQKMVEEKYEIANSRQPHEVSRSSEEHRAQVTEVHIDRELERELEEDPSAALHGGEKHNVVLEESDAAEPQFADVTESASPNTEAEETNAEPTNVEPSNFEHSNVEPSNVEPSNAEPSNDEEEKKATKQAKSKKGKKNKKK